MDALDGKYPGLSPYVYCANNPIYYIDPNGKEIRNSGKYVIQNPRLVQALIKFNDVLGIISGKKTSEFVMEVTGGDRYKTIVSGSKANPASPFDLSVDKSRTNNKIIWNSDIRSPHTETRGARGIDLSYPKGITIKQITEAAKEAGFSQYIFTYKDGHFHLTLALSEDETQDILIKGNIPNFDETKQKTVKQCNFNTMDADATFVYSDNDPDSPNYDPTKKNNAEYSGN